ncbi:MAG: hypothetical protein RJB66_952 [Pseudomonadota bacterium]
MRSLLGVFFLVTGISFSSAAFENPIWGSEYYESYGARSDYRSYGKTGTIPDHLYEAASRGQRVLGYHRARQILLGRIHLEQLSGEYAVKDVYCLRHFTNRDFRGSANLGPEKIPDGTVLNTEHTWPQSRFTGAFPNEMQKSDLHHLYPTDSEMNSTRGNYKFAELSGPTERIKCATSRFANTAIGFRFEPPPEHRGNVARSLFYFSTRYKIHIDSDEEGFLRKWHHEDPVDQAEENRHQIIFENQGNRNPFIDDASLVDQVSDF